MDFFPLPLSFIKEAMIRRDRLLSFFAAVVIDFQYVLCFHGNFIGPQSFPVQFTVWCSGVRVNEFSDAHSYCGEVLAKHFPDRPTSSLPHSGLNMVMARAEAKSL